MPCEDYREALIKTAATGVAPSREFCSHLDACASCRTAFAEELQLFAAIDSGVRATANSEVPLSFLPRMHARLADAAAPQRRWMPSLIFAGAAAAIALLAFTATRPRHSRRDDSAKQIPVTSSREVQGTPADPDAAGFPAIEASSHPNHRQPLRNSSTLHATASTSAQLEVIVPPSEREALAHFISTMQEGSGATVALVNPVPNKKDEPMSVKPLVIAKLEVKPLEKIEGETPDSTEEEQ
jgi:hypothetical protein